MTEALNSETIHIQCKPPCISCCDSGIWTDLEGTRMIEGLSLNTGHGLPKWRPEIWFIVKYPVDNNSGWKGKFRNTNVSAKTINKREKIKACARPRDSSISDADTQSQQHQIGCVIYYTVICISVAMSTLAQSTCIFEISEQVNSWGTEWDSLDLSEVASGFLHSGVLRSIVTQIRELETAADVLHGTHLSEGLSRIEPEWVKWSVFSAIRVSTWAIRVRCFNLHGQERVSIYCKKELISICAKEGRYARLLTNK